MASNEINTMAVAGFKIAVNHCLRPFKDVPIVFYTDIPAAHIKCIPENSGQNSISGDKIYLDTFLTEVSKWVGDFLTLSGSPDSVFRFEIKIFPQFHRSDEFLEISILSAICCMLNEWLHHPVEKNDLLAWLIDKNQYKDADVISACLYGGIMSHVGVRPFRIYVPKGLYFLLETNTDSEPGYLPESLLPILIMALERSDFDTIHHLLYQANPIGNMQESYLGVIDLPGSSGRLHIYNVSISDNSSSLSTNQFSKMFELDSKGCSVI